MTGKADRKHSSETHKLLQRIEKIEAKHAALVDAAKAVLDDFNDDNCSIAEFDNSMEALRIALENEDE